MKTVLRFYFRRRYGVVGALKPPLNVCRFVDPPIGDVLWFKWRHFCWSIESRLYDWSGLPEEWWKQFGEFERKYCS